MENENFKNLKGKKILFATCPLDGHINPLTGLAMHLMATGCEVAWYTSEIFTAKFEKLGIRHFTFKKAQDINAVSVDEIFPERQEITDLIEKINFDLINAFIYRAPEFLEDIIDVRKTFPFELVVCDSYFPAIPLIKPKINVPVISIGIVPLAEESIDLAPSGTGLLPSENQEELDIYQQMREELSKVVFKPAIEAFSSILDSYTVPHKKALMPDVLIRHSDLYLQIGTPSFEYLRSDIGKNIRFIGGLMPYADLGNDMSWFDKRILSYTTIVLVTQGTVEKDTRKLIEPALEAFKDTNTLLIVTTGGTNTVSLRSKYQYNNIIIEDYIPFEALMPHVDVFITNGGYSGTIISIMNNLPIIAAGVHEGKNEVCARIGYFKCGINLNTETPSAAAIRNAFKQILNNGSYKKNVMKLNREMAQYNSINLCMSYIKELLKDCNHEIPKSLI
jgi:MGT family glycosyltransferase